MRRFLGMLSSLLIIQACVIGQDVPRPHLGGTVHIDVEKSQLQSVFFLTNLASEQKELTFLLNDDLNVQSISYQGKPVAYKAKSNGCNDCVAYSLRKRLRLRPNDTLTIRTAGTYETYAPGTHRYDYKGRIANNYNILRASEQAKWYPTIVNTSQSIGTSRLPSYLSHEVAHYLFGGVFRPRSELFWFYLESFAEYLSYKYLLEDPAANQKTMRREYERLLEGKNFVRLDEVNTFDDVNGRHRYTNGPFQLLALEQRIGEERMMAFVRAVFPKLEAGQKGYPAFVESLKEVGVSPADIERFEAEVIRGFNVESYGFVESLLEGGR